jgi:hypothetical protein
VARQPWSSAWVAIARCSGRTYTCAAPSGSASSGAGVEAVFADAEASLLDPALEPVRAADELEHERRGGCWYTSSGVPTCSMRPLFMITTRSASSSASSWSCVTNTGGEAELLVQVPEPAPERLAHLRVERAEGLVQQQQLRLDRERARERHALALPARELGRVAVRHALELHALEQFRDALGALGAARPVAPALHPEPERDVVEDGHVRNSA